MTDQKGSADRGEAIGWVIRMSEPDADWNAFTTWLEIDPAHADRYDRAALALQDAEQVVAALPTPQPAVHAGEPVRVGFDAPKRRQPARWLGGAMAAAAVGALGLGVWSKVPQPYAVSTSAGEHRTVSLTDGSSIVLAGASTVRLDHREPRAATVERGEALFRVRHDAAQPFAVRVGDLRLVDLGTVFDVKAAGDITRVAVAEGSVMVDPDGSALRLDPGQAVVVDNGRIERRTVDPSDVGGWREGRLAFDDAPLAEVAADLTRQLGQRVSATPAVAARTFRGTLDLRSLRNRPALLGMLLDVNVRQGAEGWSLEARR